MLLSLLLWACDSDVSIIKRLDDDTAEVIGVGEPASQRLSLDNLRAVSTFQ